MVPQTLVNEIEVWQLKCCVISQRCCLRQSQVGGANYGQVPQPSIAVLN